MKILVACEESQEVCKAFRLKGHTAFSCDIVECSGGHPEWHLLGDVRNYLEYYWDIIIAFPPCTYMSKAGARWMYHKIDGNSVIDQERFNKMQAARDLFYDIYNCNCSKIAIENPVPLKICNLPQYTQAIQPYEFGHPYSKKTLLWLQGLPLLKPTCILDDYVTYLPSNTSNFSKGMGGSYGLAHNANVRSKTFPGIAKAMADQWG